MENSWNFPAKRRYREEFEFLEGGNNKRQARAQGLTPALAVYVRTGARLADIEPYKNPRLVVDNPFPLYKVTS